MSREDTEFSLQVEEDVELIVGGKRYTVSVADLIKHPDSFFSALLKNEWRSDKTNPIKIDRDGRIFKYVFMFLVSGILPRRQDRTIALDDTILDALKVEADFYNLLALLKECEANPAPAQVLANLGAYSTQPFAIILTT